MTKIKLCGLRRIEDIETVNLLQPDYIGFVFAPKSKRYITPDEATQLKKMLNGNTTELIKAVGVFVDEDVEKVAELLNTGVIDLAQLHGNEDEDYINELRRLMTIPVTEENCRNFCHPESICQSIVIPNECEGSLQTINYTDEQDKTKTFIDKSCIIKAFKIKTKEDMEKAKSSTADYILLDAGAGDGMRFNWDLLQGFDRPYFLAGGLDPENVKEAITKLHPYGVDVSSGIETDGYKDPEKMREFVHNVRD